MSQAIRESVDLLLTVVDKIDVRLQELDGERTLRLPSGRAPRMGRPGGAGATRQPADDDGPGATMQPSAGLSGGCATPQEQNAPLAADQSSAGLPSAVVPSCERDTPEGAGANLLTSDEFDERDDDSTLMDLPEDVPDDVDDAPPARIAARLTSPAPRPAYKPGTRKLHATGRNVITGERPWWASPDATVWAENQKRMREDPRPNKVPGENNILCMNGAR